LRDAFIASAASRYELAFCLTGGSDCSLVRRVFRVALTCRLGVAGRWGGINPATIAAANAVETIGRIGSLPLSSRTLFPSFRLDKPKNGVTVALARLAHRRQGVDHAQLKPGLAMSGIIVRARRSPVLSQLLLARMLQCAFQEERNLMPRKKTLA
jgi:hypothetical protein